jgi:23S rRNA (uracil1939-C5)-methyltransferase
MGELVEGTVESIVPGGQGLVRAEGGVILARGGLPGERVDVEIVRAQRGVRHGVVLRVIEPSSARVTPDCAIHGARPGSCGGCDLLDLAPQAAGAVREHIVDDALRRVGKLDRALIAAARRPIVAPALAPESGAEPARGRRRARLVIAGGRPTFSSAASHERVPVASCPALHPLLDAALTLVASAGLREGAEVKLACDDRGRGGGGGQWRRRG